MNCNTIPYKIGNSLGGEDTKTMCCNLPVYLPKCKFSLESANCYILCAYLHSFILTNSDNTKLGRRPVKSQ